MTRTRHLIALGGGGFSMEDTRSPIDDYILALTGQRKPRLCFIGTASGDSPIYAERFLKAFPRRRATAAVLKLFQRDRDPAEVLLNQDVIYVGGGNTANLLAVWRTHGIDRLLRQAWHRGTVLCGISAGMNCWFDACSTDSFGPLAPLNDGLGFIAGAACPHFDGEANRRPSLLKWVATDKLPHTYAADDYAAFHFTARGPTKPVLHRCLKSKLSAGCYLVTRNHRAAIVEALPAEHLGH